MINSIGIKNIGSSKKHKKARCAINNVIMKNLSKIIKEFEKLPYESYVWKRSKHEPTESYFNPERHISNIIMQLNFYVFPVIIKMTNT